MEYRFLIILLAVSILFALNVNAACVNPTDDYLVNATTEFCNGTFYLNDTGSLGLIIIQNDSVTVSCNNTVIIGNFTGTALYNGYNGISYNHTSVYNCTFINFSIGIKIVANATNTTIMNNTIVNASTYGIQFACDSSYCNQTRIYNNTISSVDHNLYINYLSDSEIIGNSFLGTDDASGDNLYIRYAYYLVIKNNSFINSSNSGIYFPPADGHSTHFINITENYFSGAGSYSILIDRDSTISNIIIWKNTFYGATVAETDTGPSNFCYGIGNYYADEAAVSNIEGDCGPHPHLGEVRINSAVDVAFVWNATSATQINYRSLKVAAENSWHNTHIIITNATNDPMNGTTISKMYNQTINCNNTMLNDPVGVISDMGVSIVDSFNITVANCTMQNFDYGIYLNNATAVSIDRVNASFNDYGVYALGSSLRVNVTNSWLYNNTYTGIELPNVGSFNAKDLLIENCSIYRNPSYGIHLLKANDTIVRNCSIHDNLGGFMAGIGIYLESEVYHSTIHNNNFSRNTYGVYFMASTVDLINITNNTFFNSSTYHVEMFFLFTGRPNYIHGNNFIEGNYSARRTDYYNNTHFGNYWDKFDEESEGCYDLVEPYGICDDDLNITFSLSENDWLPVTALFNGPDIPWINITQAINTTFSTTSITVNATTSYSSTCYYSLNTGSNVSMDGDGVFWGKSFTASSGSNTIKVTCNGTKSNHWNSTTLGFVVSLPSTPDDGDDSTGGGAVGGTPTEEEEEEEEEEVEEEEEEFPEEEEEEVPEEEEEGELVQDILPPDEVISEEEPLAEESVAIVSNLIGGKRTERIDVTASKWEEGVSINLGRKANLKIKIDTSGKPEISLAFADKDEVTLSLPKMPLLISDLFFMIPLLAVLLALTLFSVYFAHEKLLIPSAPYFAAANKKISALIPKFSWHFPLFSGKIIGKIAAAMSLNKVYLSVSSGNNFAQATRAMDVFCSYLGKVLDVDGRKLSSVLKKLEKAGARDSIKQDVSSLYKWYSRLSSKPKIVSKEEIVMKISLMRTLIRNI